MSTPITPRDLATELHRSPKTIRAWLRTNYTRPENEKGDPWHLTPDQADAGRAHFNRGTSTQH